MPNVCEYAVGGEDNSECVKTLNRDELIDLQNKGYQLVSYPIVLHAEANAITKLAKSNNSSDGATIYITDEPCIECAKLIIQSKIERVVYNRDYRKHDGIELLNKANIKVDKILI
jgi:deoxycytidylate deaminase